MNTRKRLTWQALLAKDLLGCVVRYIPENNGNTESIGKMFDFQPDEHGGYTVNARWDGRPPTKPHIPERAEIFENERAQLISITLPKPDGRVITICPS
jgi:hypothetical protein